MPSSPKVSVIIVSYQRSADLRLAMRAVLESTWKNVELIVVDNASNDDSADVAASIPGVRVVRNARNEGFAEGCNRGLREATGEYVALVNDDAVIDRGWIEAMTRFLEAHPRAAAVGSRTYYWDQENPVESLENRFYGYTTVDPETGFNEPTFDCDQPEREVATLSGAVVMIRRRAIDELGPTFLEPTFFAYYEETDFFARALRHGWTLHYLSAPAAWHRVRASTATRPHAYFHWMARNRLVYAYRNFDDDVLAGVLRAARLDELRLAARRRFGLLGVEEQARLEAFRWVREHRALLEAQRRASMATGASYNARVRAIEARARETAKLPERPLVSIVIPCFNYGRYLAEAIESARAQTHPDVEVIVVDDGSTDDTAEIAARYPVKLVRQRNRGVGAARNRGASEARGELLVFLDADDVLEPTYVARCLAALAAEGPEVAYAYTQMRYFGDQDGIHESGAFSRRNVLRGNLVNASAMMRVSAFRAAGGYSPAFRDAWEDHELWVRMFSLGYRGVLVPEPLLRYRRHGRTRNSLTESEQRALDWRIWWQYPRLYWPRLAAHPLRLARSLVRGSA
jgi:GT2 family glycosyltransferase